MGEVPWDRWEQLLTWILKIIENIDFCSPLFVTTIRSGSGSEQQWMEHDKHIGLLTWNLQERGGIMNERETEQKGDRASEQVIYRVNQKSMSKIVPTCPKVLHPLQWCFIHHTKCHNHGYWWFKGILILSTWARATACESCYSNFWTPCTSYKRG